jgi:hypothetical protein
VQNLATSQIKISELSPEPERVKFVPNNQKLTGRRQKSKLEASILNVSSVTPARDPVPSFEEIKDSSVRFMNNLVSSFTDHQPPESAFDSRFRNNLKDQN